MCEPERACVYAGDGWTERIEDGEIGGFACVRACVRDPACVPLTVCEDLQTLRPHYHLVP